MEDLKYKLQQLGLSGREAEVYLALLQTTNLSAPEVAKLTPDLWQLKKEAKKFWLWLKNVTF